MTDSEGSYTYGELDRVSNSVALLLSAQGIRENSFVAIKMGRVKEFIAAVVGVQKAGAAYVPIDPAYPEDRIAYMLEDSGARAVLTREAVAHAMEEYSDPTPVNRATPANAAYMIYTSGSTGKPKGVVISHRALMAYTSWGIHAFGIAPDSVHAHHPSFSFDASINDIVWPLAAGGRTHILSEALRRDADAMADYIEAHHVAVISLSTQIGMLLVNQHPGLPLKCVMMGGEKLMPCAGTDIVLVNSYGPTEFTVCSSFHIVDQAVDGNIPIGRPVPNTWSLICDADGRMLPRGMAGELCLVGAQIAEGYWNRPGLTAEKFVDCPCLPGRKMYRTGDLARYNEAGELDYLGRIDNQVKLRGFRIEMGEIENRASQYEGIRQVAAAVKNDQIVLYYVPNEGAAVDPAGLRSFLAEALTDYMVPTIYMPLDAMPMTPNGKINRKALPEPEASRNAEMIEPETETERRLYEIAAQILGTRAFGVTDNLVSLGLNSILAMRFAALIGQTCEAHIPVSAILRTPVIRALAEGIAQDDANARGRLKSYPIRELYPVTENQRGIIIDWERNRNTAQYNIPDVIPFEGVTGESLVQAVKAAVEAHRYLKAGFVYAEDDVM